MSKNVKKMESVRELNYTAPRPTTLEDIALLLFDLSNRFTALSASVSGFLELRQGLIDSFREFKAVADKTLEVCQSKGKGDIRRPVHEGSISGIVIRALQKIFLNSGLKNGQICERTGLIKNEVSNIFAGKRNVSLDRALRIARDIGYLDAFVLDIQSRIKEHCKLLSQNE